jgi:protein SCO1
MLRTVFLISSIACVWACGPGGKNRLPYYNTPGFTPQFLTSRQAAHSITHTIGAFSCTNQHNRTITQNDVKGKIHVANFIFTSCGSICPVMTEQMMKVQTAYGGSADVVILSYSVTPWIDSVPRLHSYAAIKGITAPNWHLLTGGKAAVYQLARQSYFAEEDLGFTKDSTEFLHTEHCILVDKQQRIRGIYNGTLALDMEQLVQDIDALRREDNE